MGNLMDNHGDEIEEQVQTAKEDYLKGLKDDTTNKPDHNGGTDHVPDGAGTNGDIDKHIDKETQLTEEELRKKEDRADYHQKQDEKRKKEQQNNNGVEDSGSGFFGFLATLGVIAAFAFVVLKWLGFIGDSETATAKSGDITANSTANDNSETAQQTAVQKQPKTASLEDFVNG